MREWTAGCAERPQPVSHDYSASGVCATRGGLAGALTTRMRPAPSGACDVRGAYVNQIDDFGAGGAYANESQGGSDIVCCLEVPPGKIPGTSGSCTT
ncbi:hypothetical protein EMIT0158MI4_230017 [Burkholderia ambifaria]